MTILPARYFFFATIIALSCYASTSQATPQEDADYIADQTVTRELFEAALEAERSTIVSAIQFDLQSKGVILPHPDRFLDLIMEEFIDGFTETMQNETANLYVKQFSEQELADIAAFYRTEAGQALINQTPELLLESSRNGRIAGERAGENLGKRLTARIKAEGLIEVDDPSLLSRLIDALK